MLMLPILLLRLSVLLATAVLAPLLIVLAAMAVVSMVSGVAMRGFRLGSRLGGLLRGCRADAEYCGGDGAEGEVAKCFHLDLLRLAQEIPCTPDMAAGSAIERTTLLPDVLRRRLNRKGLH